MKKVKIISWSSKTPDGDVTDSNINIINYVTHIGVQNEKLAGFDIMRKLNRIGVQLDKAQKLINDKKEGEMEFEEDDFKLIIGFIEKHAPGVWGGNKDIMNAVEEIMKLK